ncbi:MAG: prepilin-type N-terminal cleavage/methylation domain-containing protein [bacterium]
MTHQEELRGAVSKPPGNKIPNVRWTMVMKIPHAFTLIELLIVVAIIGILAMIAVPNFLNAQIRAKVARMENDLRAAGTALEAYRVDTGWYPGEFGFTAPPGVVGGTGDSWNYLLYRITTPVAYITSVPMDVFRIPKEDEHPNESVVPMPRPISYFQQYTSPPTPNHRWMVYSYGPDGTKYYDHAALPYNPSNGVVSPGNIYHGPYVTVLDQVRRLMEGVSAYDVE